METKKKSSKANSKIEKSPKVEKVIEKVIEKDANDYTGILKNIFVALVCLNVILALLLITVLVKNNGNTVSGDSQGGSQTVEESGEYDVSMFDTLSTTDAISKINEGNRTVVYIGRSTCGYCVKFLPTLQQAQKEYGYKTIYIDLEKMTSEDQSALVALDDSEGYINENFGYTPMVLIFEEGKLKKGWVGYSEYNEFASFLEENGLKK